MLGTCGKGGEFAWKGWQLLLSPCPIEHEPSQSAWNNELGQMMIQCERIPSLIEPGLTKQTPAFQASGAAAREKM